MDTRIYIMTHKQFEAPNMEGYQVLHVGKSGKADLGYPGDDTGDQISGKNASYCELTGLYWIWKNISCDIVGLCHYRRYFSFAEGNKECSLEEQILTKTYVEELLEQYDLIVPNSSMTQTTSVLEQYEQRHDSKDLLICGEIIRQMYPEDYTAFEWSINANFVSLGNMVIAKKEVLDAYCAWLFPILEEAEKRIDTSNYDAYQKRIMGFLAERLFRVWILNQEYKVREEQTIFLAD